MPRFYYSVFGLRLVSSIELPELEAVSAGPVDVEIQTGVVPDSLPDAAQTAGAYQANRAQFLLRLRRIGAYLVEGGSRITIDPISPDLRDIRVFLYGSCLAALLIQRGLVPLHASAVLLDQKVVLIAGGSPVGKSTLAAQLALRGATFLADDLAAIQLDQKGTACLTPGLQRPRLWRKAMEKLNLTAKVAIRDGLEKYEIDLGNPLANAQYADDKASQGGPNPTGSEDYLRNIPRGKRRCPVGAILILNEWNAPVFQRTELKAASDKLATILAASHLSDLASQRAARFRICSALASTAAVVQITRPSAGFRIQELADFIQSELKSLP